LGSQKKTISVSLIQKKVTALAFELIRDRANTISVSAAMVRLRSNFHLYRREYFLTRNRRGRCSAVLRDRPSEVVINSGPAPSANMPPVRQRDWALVKSLIIVYSYELSESASSIHLHPKVILESMRTADVVIGAIHTKKRERHPA